MTLSKRVLSKFTVILWTQMCNPTFRIQDSDFSKEKKMYASAYGSLLEVDSFSNIELIYFHILFYQLLIR